MSELRRHIMMQKGGVRQPTGIRGDGTAYITIGLVSGYRYPTIELTPLTSYDILNNAKFYRAPYYIRATRSTTIVDGPCILYGLYGASGYTRGMGIVFNTYGGYTVNWDLNKRCKFAIVAAGRACVGDLYDENGIYIGTTPNSAGFFGFTDYLDVRLLHSSNEIVHNIKIGSGYDFIPYVQNGEVGLLNTVDNTFHENSNPNGGAFTAIYD